MLHINNAVTYDITPYGCAALTLYYYHFANQNVDDYNHAVKLFEHQMNNIINIY